MSCCAIENCTSSRSSRSSFWASVTFASGAPGIAEQREIRCRQRLQVEAAFPCLHLEAVVLRVERDVGAVGQRAQDVLELARGDGEVLVARAFAGFAARRDLDLEVGRHELELVLFSFQQDVRQDRQRVAFFDDAGDRLQRFQQRIAFDLEKFHDVLL